MNPQLKISGRLWSTMYRFIARMVFGFASRLLITGPTEWRWKSWTSRSAARLSDKSAPVVWFHAASAGELEILWSVARAIQNSDSFRGVKFILTVFSPSGRTRLSQFEAEFSPLYCGPSPMEGEWELFFQSLDPEIVESVQLLITAKYEAWPELWALLAARRIPLLIVNAEWRLSLLIALRLTRWIFGRLPQVWFSCGNPAVAEDLAQQWLSRLNTRTLSTQAPRSLGDPRWDQVFSRLGSGSTRVQELRLQASTRQLPLPWVVVGSAWEEDLRFLLKAAKNAEFKGTFWVVPHRPSAVQAKHWGELISSLGAHELIISGSLLDSTQLQDIPIFSGALQDSSPKPREVPASSFTVVLVQEMGILAELYAIGQASWVGGGFRTGLHSVIEPALSNLRVGAGSKIASQFPEVQELREIGQLELFECESSAAQWLRSIPQEVPNERLEDWQQWRLKRHLGAACRIATWAAEIVRVRRAV
ncbi:MAG: hypothetical protein KGQ59_06825 [Bdellovibrionales bacterium]|nr:hypothetical protein [Bdellovibrionales bacterium]